MTASVEEYEDTPDRWFDREVAFAIDEGGWDAMLDRAYAIRERWGPIPAAEFIALERGTAR